MEKKRKTSKQKTKSQSKKLHAKKDNMLEKQDNVCLRPYDCRALL